MQLLHKKLQRLGNSRAVVIPEAIRTELDWEEDDVLEMEIHDDHVVLRKHIPKRKSIEVPDLFG